MVSDDVVTDFHITLQTTCDGVEYKHLSCWLLLPEEWRVLVIVICAEVEQNRPIQLLNTEIFCHLIKARWSL